MITGGAPADEKLLMCVCTRAQPQSCPAILDSHDCSPPAPLHGILQARILDWVAMPSSRGSSRPRDGTLVSYVSCTGRRVLYHRTTWEAP